MSCLCSSSDDKAEIKIDLEHKIDIIEKPSVPRSKNIVVNLNTVIEIEPDKALKKLITFKPKVDILYDSSKCQSIIVLDIPGFKVEDLDVEIGEGILAISGPRSKEELFDIYGDKLILHAKEREVGFFKRIFKLPNNVLDDTTKAVYKNGILEIKMDCKQFSEMHKVEISED